MKHSPEEESSAENDKHFLGNAAKHHESAVTPVGLFTNMDGDDASMLDEMYAPYKTMSLDWFLRLKT